jgi:hypothetical protein
VGVVINKLWLCLIVFGFKANRTGRDFFLGFLVHPYGVQSKPPSMKVDFYFVRRAWRVAP